MTSAAPGTDPRYRGSLHETRTINRVSWNSHVMWMRQNFHPGQHISVIVPTGGGKSYLTVNGLLKLPVVEHSRVLFVDDKGEDSTTRVFGEPIHRYPHPLHYRVMHGRRDDEPQHYRLIIPDWQWSPDGSSHRGVENARKIVGEALAAWYREASESAPSIVVLDETAAVTGTKPPSLNMAASVKHLWRKIRFRAGSVIALTQAPLGVPSEMYHQPTHLYIGPILDQEQRRRLREIGGNSKVIEHTVEQLQDREFLFLGNKGRHMQIVMVGRN